MNMLHKVETPREGFKHVVYVSPGSDQMLENFIAMTEQASGQPLIWCYIPEIDRVEVFTSGNVDSVLKVMYSE